jgi:hypothetical protein
MELHDPSPQLTSCKAYLFITPYRRNIVRKDIENQRWLNDIRLFVLEKLPHLKVERRVMIRDRTKNIDLLHTAWDDDLLTVGANKDYLRVGQPLRAVRP